MDRASDYESEGRRFESCRARQPREPTLARNAEEDRVSTYCKILHEAARETRRAAVNDVRRAS